MTPEDLAKRHPQLFHATLAGNAARIRKTGLLSTSALLDRFEIVGEERQRLERRKRDVREQIRHRAFGTTILNDQKPLSEKALATCLDDGLMPSDWLALLNARVFFWADAGRLKRLLEATANRECALDVLVVDTLALARAHADRLELCPINSGSTIHKPARRGRGTFTPLLSMAYAAWSQRRGNRTRDKIVEVAVVGGVPDIASYILEVRTIPAAC